MRTRLFKGTVSHTRYKTTRHTFRYSYPMFFIDLDEISGIADRYRLFGLNRRRFFTIDEDRFFSPGQGSLKERIFAFLEKEDISTEDINRIGLLTVPSFFGLGFNPVSFYFLQRDDGRIEKIISEVNNTFKERHLYLLTPEENSDGGKVFQSSTDKVFHVSPFFEVEGTYQFRIALKPEGLSVTIDYLKEESTLLSATLNGKWGPFSGRTLRSELIRHPLVRLLTMARIHYQAAILYFKKKLPIHKKPEPISPNTIPARKMRALDLVARNLLSRYLKKIDHGTLQVFHWNAPQETFGSSNSSPKAIIRIEHPRFYRKVLFGGDIAFGESYENGDWTTDDLPGLLEFLIQNRKSLEGNVWAPFFLFAALGRWNNRLRLYNRSRSQENVAAHYDLSDRFFEQFLDPSMTYSCAYFTNDKVSLPEAQQEKIDRILTKAEIHPENKVLEIGTGWGALAKTVAQRCDCPITSVTLSKDQFNYARNLIDRAKLSDRVQIDFKDYREVSGIYDRIVSVEMLEAVGERNLPVFFKKCQDLLRPDGKAVLQVITFSEQYYDAYRKGRDWIQKHIFPGGFLPSIKALEDVIGNSTDFSIIHREDIGLHYATTIREWRKRFLSNQEEIHRLGFDESFCRKWLYYFAYCEAGFATKTLGVQQIVLGRRG